MVAIIHSRESAAASPATVKKPNHSRQEAAYDFELVQRFKAGDQTAFVEIMNRHRARVFALALASLHNRMDAEEITQDTFIRVHRSVAFFRGDSSLATWICRIASNLSRNLYKYYSVRRRQATDSLDRRWSDDSCSCLQDRIATTAPNPAREASTREFSENLDRCLERLDPSQRQILRMHHQLFLSYDEIARALCVRNGTVKSRIARARESLRVLFAEAYHESPDTSLLGGLEPVGSTPGLLALHA